MAVLPIKPNEIEKQKEETFPDAVLESFNQLIAERFNGRSATVRQEDVVKLMVEKGLNSKEIYDRGWLDVEGVYRRAGWRVEYDKPGYNETYPATFTFTRKSAKA